MEKLFVVMPIYQAQKFLRRSIRSVLQQSFSDFRLILVDDGSTDASGKICDDFAKRDNRVTVLHQVNQGSFLARKNGVMQCPDDGYILFADADDCLLPNALQTFYDGVQAYHADACTANMAKMYRGHVFRKKHSPSETKVVDQKEFFDTYFCSWFGITRLPVTMWGKIFRADLLKAAYNETPETITRFFGDDLLVTLHFFVKCEQIVFLSDEVYAYRVGGGSSRYRPEMMEEFLSLYAHKLAFAASFQAPQNLQLLSDIELCNVTFSFFKTLYQSKALTPQDRLSVIRSTIQDARIRAAAENVLQSSFKHKTYAKWITENNAEAFLFAAKPTQKEQFKAFLLRHS